MSQIRTLRPVLLGLLLLSLLTILSSLSSRTEVSAGENPNLFLPYIASPVVFASEQTGASFLNTTDITHAGDARLFVVERAGMIKILQPDGQVDVFLNLTDKVASDTGELGMFALEFDPDYAENGRFYVTYTEEVRDKWQLRLSQFTVSGDPDVADPTSEIVLVNVTQDFAIHNGGGLVYNEHDGNLYMGVGEDSQFLIAQGDSGSKGKVLLVKINEAAVRPEAEMVALDEKTAVAPFVDVDRIARGFRNPWRLAASPNSGDLFVGDVGDRTWEEINLIPYGFTGQNFGWPCKEGPDERLEDPVCNRGFNDPIHYYADGCSIIVGEFYYYQGNRSQPPRLIFADGCSNQIQMLRPAPDRWYAEPVGEIVDLPSYFLTTFGSDSEGSLYVGFLGESPLVKLTIPPILE